MKSALITGSSTGIGFQLSKDLIEAGWKIFGSVRKQEDADRLQEELGSQFHPLLFDVTDYGRIEAAYNPVAEKIPEGLDLLVNNAGLAIGGPLLHVPLEEIEYQFKVNVFGLMKVTQTFAPLLGAREDHDKTPGRIIQISSVSGKVGMPFVGPYVGSKFAVEGMSESLRRELLLYGIDVIVIGPGAIKTPIWNKGINAAEIYAETPYVKALTIFQKKFLKGIIKSAMPVEELSKEIVKIIQSSKPKTRYTFMNKKFMNFTLPRLLPARSIDKSIGKHLFQ